MTQAFRPSLLLNQSASLVETNCLHSDAHPLANRPIVPLHIKDAARPKRSRRLARARKLTLTEAVRVACQETLDCDARAVTSTFSSTSRHTF